jgi:hypothetical protein
MTKTADDRRIGGKPPRSYCRRTKSRSDNRMPTIVAYVRTSAARHSRASLSWRSYQAAMFDRRLYQLPLDAPTCRALSPDLGRSAIEPHLRWVRLTAIVTNSIGSSLNSLESGLLTVDSKLPI